MKLTKKGLSDWASTTDKYGVVSNGPEPLLRRVTRLLNCHAGERSTLTPEAICELAGKCNESNSVLAAPSLESRPGVLGTARHPSYSCL